MDRRSTEAAAATDRQLTGKSSTLGRPCARIGRPPKRSAARAAIEGIGRRRGLADAGLRISLMDVPAKAAFGADETGTESMAGGAGALAGLAAAGLATRSIRGIAARPLPPFAAPTLTHSPGLLSPPGGE